MNEKPSSARADSPPPPPAQTSPPQPHQQPTSVSASLAAAPPPSARILVTMGSCGAAVGQLQCPCPGGMATSRLGAAQDESSLRCSLCEHFMSDHSDYVPQNQDVTATRRPQTPVVPPHPIPEQPSVLDSYVCPREDTVSKLADLLAEWTVVHVRGTPSSGKTTLGKLLQRHYVDEGLKQCVFTTGWRGGDDNPIQTCAKLYESVYGPGPNLDDLGFFDLNDVVFIIDEAQESYTDQTFWLSVLKAQSGQGYGPRFCLFSYYGSPSTGLSALTMRSTPLRFGPPQRVSLVPSSFSPDLGLFYTDDEFRDAVQRQITLPDRSAFSFDNDSLSYLYAVTNGHPAAVTALVDYIYNTYRAEIKHGHIENIDTPRVLKAMEDDISVLSYLQSRAVGRSFPRSDLLTVDAANVLRHTLANGSIHFDENDQGIALCYKMGWLQVDAVDFVAANSVCVFPTRIHEKFVEINLASDYKRPFPLEIYPTIAGLCEHVLKNFSKSQLQLGFQGRVSTSGKYTNAESQFQDEFYRSFTNLLGHGIGISSEWSKNADGRIDFYITGPGWGIEFLRDGDRLSEHCRRFAPMGAYSDWISSGYLKDWLVIDCRHSEPKQTTQQEPKLWRVVFEDCYTKAHVLNCDNDIIVSEFPLLA